MSLDDDHSPTPTAAVAGSLRLWSAVWAPLRKAIAWIGGHELPVLIGLLILVLAVWGFVAIADVVTEGRTQNFDNWVIRSLRRPDNPAKPIGPVWLHEVGRDLS